MREEMDLEKLTLAVCEIARRAGAYIREERKKFSLERVERKHAHDYVSYVDKGSEQLIVAALQELLPEAGFITEEGTAISQGDGSSVTFPMSQKNRPPVRWVVDPLDGTTNFIHQYAPYAVSIALLQGKEILIGVVYEICADECFYAWKGGGAYLEVKIANKREDSRACSDYSERERFRRSQSEEVKSQKLRVSSQKIQDALLCLQLPYNSDAYKPTIKRMIDAFYGNVGSIRMCGSAAMALCYVAAGRLDGYAEQYIGQWDFMAGSLIVMEAGGTVTDYSGSSDFTQGNSVIATNGIIQNNLLDVVFTTERQS